MKQFLKKRRNIFLIALPAMLFLGIAFSSQTGLGKASISLMPNEGSFAIGQSFSVEIKVNAKSAINAAEATIKFPKDALEVVDISKKDSIFTLWIREPSFSNETGIIEFVGGLHDGGFKGEGSMATITFKPKAAGKASVYFSDALVLAHDGKGTSVLGEKIGAEYFIRGKEALSADLNGDGKISTIDFSIFIASWFGTYKAQNDFNQDGRIDMADFSILLSKLANDSK